MKYKNRNIKRRNKKQKKKHGWNWWCCWLVCLDTPNFKSNQLELVSPENVYKPKTTNLLIQKIETTNNKKKNSSLLVDSQSERKPQIYFICHQ